MTTCIQNINSHTTYDKPINTLINAAQKLLEVRKGDLIFVDFDQLIKSGRDHSIQSKPRPAVVLSNNVGNKFSPTIWVATLTSNLNKNKLPTHVKVSEETGLRFDSLVLVEQVFTIDKKLILSKVGKCSAHIMEQIDTAVKIQAGTIDLEYIEDTVNWINKVECEARINGFDPEDARLHTRLVKELQSYCNQYGYDYTKVLKEKTFIKVSVDNRKQNAM
jgi:mRNA interferase MazF